MWAHEEPGAELLLVMERGRGSARAGVRAAVEAMLDTLTGGLIDWWQPFTPGTVALRIAAAPRMVPRPRAEPVPEPDEGRTPETSGPAYLPPEQDIPPELLAEAMRAAELRRAREGASTGLLEVVLRRVWIEAQAAAMTEGLAWGAALRRILADEARRAYDPDG